MSLPVSHGYPDWARQSAEQDVTLLYQTGTVLNAASNTATFFVGVMPYLSIFYNIATNRGRLTAFWCLDQAGTQVVGVDKFLTAAAGSVACNIPVLGPWVFFAREASAYPDTVDTRIVMAQAPRIPSDEPPFLPMLFNVEAAAVAAGATVNVNSVRTLPGLATLCVDTALATWTAFLRALEFAGTFQYLYSLRNTSLPGPRLITLPATSVRLAFTNTTAAAGTFSASLIGRSTVM